MTKIRDRFFAGFGALLFLVTGSALAIAVIVNGVSNHNKNKQAADTSAQTKQLADCSTAGATPQANQKISGQQLQGSALSDFTPCKVPSLLKQDITVGSGVAVKAGDDVTVDYTGAVASTGKIFQSSLDSGQTASFNLDGVIKGWTDGVPGMQVGGIRRLYIPAAQAYGANPPSGSGIPANADLVFDITLHKIGS